MKKRLLAILLSLIMVVSLLPATAIATDGDPAKLDISQGSITITSEGYQQGEDSPVKWGEDNSAHALTITQSDPATPIENCIHVLASAKLTLKGINLNGSMYEESTETTTGPFFVSGKDVTVDIILEGENSLTSNSYPGLEVTNGASITIQVPEGEDDTFGSLDALAYGGNNAGIGSRARGASGNSITIKSGTITAKGNGMGASIGGNQGYASIANITITGGHVTAQGGNPIGYSQVGNGSEISISGGTVVAPNGFSYKTISITGGNIGDSYSGTITDRTLTKLAFFDAEGNPQCKKEVTVTEGSGAAAHTWTAQTDENGMITTYLANGTESISATVGDTTYSGIRIAEGLGVVGAFCTCADYPGTLTMITEPQSLTTIDGTATLSGLAATYTKDSCVLPEGFHGDYENNVSFEITKVVKNGQYMVADQYAKIEGTTLTVYDETNRDPYTVYVRAYSGPANSYKAYSNEIAITVNTNASASSKNQLDISNGPIIITSSGYRQGGGTETAWGENSNALTITQSNPNTPVRIILKFKAVPWKSR